MTTATLTMDQQEQIARIERMQQETPKITRDTYLSGWQLVITGMAAGGALIGATVAAMKAFGG
ncbi:MAG: hypothetical protein ACTHM2_05150 [Afipia sp.]